MGRWILGLGVLVLAACSDTSVPPAQGVRHLDLRLADGRSPALAIAGGMRVLETSIAATAGSESPAADAPRTWQVSDARVSVLEAGGAQRLEPRAAGGRPVLALDQPLAADQWDAFELIGRFGGPTRLRFVWRSGDERHTVERDAPLTLDPELQRFELAAHPGWSGTVQNVRLELGFQGAPTLDVTALRFVAGGLQAGFEALDAELRTTASSPAELSGDMGLVVLGHDARRAWPSDLELPLFATLTVPRGGALSVALATGAPLVGTRDPITFRVEARRSADERIAWELIGRKQVTPPPQAAASSWHPWLVDLQDFAGAEIELRLRADDGSDIMVAAGAPTSEPGGSTPNEARPHLGRVLWGAPEVLGELHEDRRPNIVLVTLDTTRADALGNGWTPNLDRLAQRGLLFETSFATAESTTPSHASLLTGLMVQQHGALGNRYVLPDHNRTLAEFLRAEGYHTAAAVCAPHLHAGNGFGQGFDEFVQARRHSLVEGRYAVEGLEALLEEWSAGPARPLFLWLHLFDPHTPYISPQDFVEQTVKHTGLELPPREATPGQIPSFAAQQNKSWLKGATSLAWARHRYQLGVAYADQLCGRFFEALDEHGVSDNAAILVTSDHGEAFGEHQLWFRHVSLFEPITRVPLILLPPPGSELATGRRIADPVSGIDVLPTLLELAGAEAPAYLLGKSLVSIAAGQGDPQRRVWFQHSNLQQVGFRDPDDYFIDTLAEGVTWLPPQASEMQSIPVGTRFLFDAHSGAADSPNRVAQESALVEQSTQTLELWMQALGRGDVQRAELSVEQEALLRQLGYAGDSQDE